MNECRGRHRQGAFTLLEVLVVLLIIGIISGLAMLSIGGAAVGERMQTEARRLGELMRLASDTAVLRSTQIGLLLDEEGYRFLMLDADGWQPWADDGPLRPRALPDPLNARLQAEGVTIPMADEAADEDALRPQVLFLSSGEITPFRLELHAPELDTFYRISGQLSGALDITRVEPGDV